MKKENFVYSTIKDQHSVFSALCISVETNNKYAVKIHQSMGRPDGEKEEDFVVVVVATVATSVVNFDEFVICLLSDHRWFLVCRENSLHANRRSSGDGVGGRVGDGSGWRWERGVGGGWGVVRGGRGRDGSSGYIWLCCAIFVSLARATERSCATWYICIFEPWSWCTAGQITDNYASSLNRLCLI